MTRFLWIASEACGHKLFIERLLVSCIISHFLVCMMATVGVALSTSL